MSASRRLLPTDVAPDDLDAPFWEGCTRGELLLHRCDVCGRHYWPVSSCVDHGGDTMSWVPSSGRGRVHTYTVIHHAYEPSMADRVAASAERALAGNLAKVGDKLEKQGKLFVRDRIDLLVDPGETKDVAAEHPKAVERLAAAYEAWFRDVSATRG